MRKTILVGISALVLAFTTVVKADGHAGMSISGYQEFFVGSADQTTAAAGSTEHGYDMSKMSNGNYSRLTATYSSTLDSGLDLSGIYTVNARDCQGSRDAICGVVNYNSINLAGAFGTIGFGEKFSAPAAMLSRMTAGVPTGEPDGGILGHFYTGGSNDYGSANETNYADNSMKVTFNSNVYSGFSFAAGFTPNMAEEGSADNAQATTITNSEYTSFSDVLSTMVKYSGEMDGIGFSAAYGMISGNAGQVAGTNYNDLEETVYSATISYANFSADIRKNEKDNSGQVKNNQAGNDEGTSICAMYSMANIGVGACQVDTSFTDLNNLNNSSKTRTYSADYNLGGGMKVGIVYFDIEQTANNVTDLDVDGIVSKISVGF
jgi:hypothetical protein